MKNGQIGFLLAFATLALVGIGFLVSVTEIRVIDEKVDALAEERPRGLDTLRGVVVTKPEAIAVGAPGLERFRVLVPIEPIGGSEDDVVSLYLSDGLFRFLEPLLEFEAGDTIEVPEGRFSLRVEEARTEFDEENTLSEYVSVVTVLEDGVEVGRHRIEVNSPLVHRGIGVYQLEMLAV